MNLKCKKIGVAITGSFCTFEKLFEQLKLLKDTEADLIPITSIATQTIDSRFGTPDKYL